MKVSQSLIKGLQDYILGKECGYVFKAKYLDSRFDLFPPSDAQNVGAWFEYMATGSIPKNGAVPQPEYMKRNKDENGNPELTAPYRLMKKQVDNFNKMIEMYGFEILRVGEDVKVLLPNSMEEFGFEVFLTGTLDIRARATKDIYAEYGEFRKKKKVLVAKEGQVVIIDLKATGLLEDKWSEFGWQLDNLGNKTKLITQPIHYKYIDMLNFGEEPPFLFLLFSTTNELDARIIDFRLDESTFDRHLDDIKNTVLRVAEINKYGVKALPNLKKCTECPLAPNCQFKAEVPPISVFYLDEQV
jgi:hypothetical protein